MATNVLTGNIRHPDRWHRMHARCQLACFDWQRWQHRQKSGPFRRCHQLFGGGNGGNGARRWKQLGSPLSRFESRLNRRESKPSLPTNRPSQGNIYMVHAALIETPANHLSKKQPEVTSAQKCILRLPSDPKYMGRLVNEGVAREPELSRYHRYEVFARTSSQSA